MPKYGLISRIGQGAQGVLVKARVIETGATVAIKRIHLKTDVKNQIDVMREIFCLKNCNHENIVKLQDSFFDDSTASIVMEFVDSNFKLIIMDSTRPQNDSLLHHYFKQIFSAVAYLHGINIMHRDIKPENILVTVHNKIKLGDFGLACLYVPNSKKTYSHQVFTRWYRAPELLFGSITYDPKVDIWACGCMLVEYLNGSPLFMGYNDIDQIIKVFSILGTPNEETWPGWSSLPDANKILIDTMSPNLEWSQIVPTASLPVKQLIQDLIRLNPSSRLSAEQCVQRLERIKSDAEISYKPPVTNYKCNEITFNRDLEIEGIQNDFNNFQFE